MAYHEYYLKLSKASWGIVIGYKGDIVNNLEKNSATDFEKVCEGIFLKLDLILNPTYVEQIRILIENGIRWVADIIPEKDRLYITISEIDFNLCNFQIEGFFFGVAKWVCSYYNIDMPEFSYIYDRKLNSYFFNFDRDEDGYSFDLLYPKVE